ncbi:hypothetical protein BKA65DRAFT_502144 [Rhexocercosporidium sp. MPI-PUGE-AT-0058]|nr:hypothetical protein BKA65DRAFT_502144 [Rhexocercosporidium sp. MPI-PUGE-AT-0058]
MRAYLILLILVGLIAADVLKNDEASKLGRTEHQRSSFGRESSNDAARCSEDSLEPGFLPPMWNSRRSPSDQKPVVDAPPEVQPVIPPTNSCECKFDQDICCTNYIIRSLPSREWFWAAGVLLLIYFLPVWFTRWILVITKLRLWWRYGVLPQPGPVGREKK